MKLVPTLGGLLNGTASISDRTKYNLLSVSIAFVHAVLTAIFFYIGSVPMGIYNIFSVSGYLFCMWLVRKNALWLVYGYICIEVPLHSLLATYTAGWDFGFAMYLIAIVPVGFEMSFALKDTVKGIKSSVLFGMLNIVSFFGCHLYSQYFAPLYKVEDDIFISVIYGFNALCTFVLLTVYSFVFVTEIRNVQHALESKNDELARLASRDTLTGLYNRRIMHEYLNSAAKEGRFSIIMSDIDNFKRINDTYGHDCGDEVLKTVSETVSYCLPEGDIVCRWGGEEFLMLTSNSLDGAADIAEKIRAAIESRRVSFGGNDIRVTMTFGVSEFSPLSTVDKTITSADKKLYEGKNSGKNRVVK